MPEKKKSKKSDRKKSVSWKSSIAKPSPRLSKIEMDRLILENSISLQKVLTNLAIKFDNLSDQISKLLSLFEISAKSFAEKNSGNVTQEDKEFLKKLDELMGQNKLIAKGLTMMEERIRGMHTPQTRNQLERRPI